MTRKETLTYGRETNGARFGRLSRFCARSGKARRLHGWVGGSGTLGLWDSGTLGESWVRTLRARLPRKRRLGGRTSSRNYRRWLRRRCRRAWVLTTPSTYRNCTSSSTAPTHYWMILRPGSETGRATPNHPSVHFL